MSYDHIGNYGELYILIKQASEGWKERCPAGSKWQRLALAAVVPVDREAIPEAGSFFKDFIGF